MDYTKINKKLQIEKSKSLKWLKSALEKPKNNLDYKNDMIINYLIESNNEKGNLIKDLYNKIDENQNWIKLFGIYNTKEYLIFYLFGIRFTFKMNEEMVNKLAWRIPIRKCRDNFRNKFFR